MKTTYIFFLSVLFVLTAFGQTEGITYQAVLVDNNPDEIPGVDVPSSNFPEQPLTIRFSILSANGTIAYQETQETQTDPYGTINLTIGTGLVTSESSGAFNQINWDGPKTLHVAIDLEAGTNFSEFSAQPLTYIPYVRHREVIADGSLRVAGPSNLNDELTVSGATSLQSDLSVNGASTFNDMVRIDATAENIDQENYNAYPLQLQGSSHGMAIQLNSANPGRTQNFMSFWNSNGAQVGRIEGFQAGADFDLGIIFDLITNFEEPEEDELPEDEDELDEVIVADTPTDFDIYLNNDYSINLLFEYLDVLESTYQLVANYAGCGFIVGCDDVVGLAFEVFVQGIQISLYIAYHEKNVGVAFESGGADYAEWLKKYDKNEVLTFGDVVGLKAGIVSKNFTDADTFMVVSKSPIISGAMPAEEDKGKYKQVAFLGQVPVKVIGTVIKGDYILPSGNGDGMGIAVSPEHMRTNDYNRIIGVAWDDYQGKDLFSYINTAVGINSNDLTREVNAMQVIMNRMQDALVQLNPSYQPSYFDVNTVSVSNTIKTSKSLSLQEIMALQYGIDSQGNTQEVLMEINQLMKSEDVSSSHFKFADLPYLEEVLTDPTPENIKNYKDFYAKAKNKLTSMIGKVN